MSFNTFGHMFRVTTFGESHGVAIGCVVDGCPPRIELDAADIQTDLDRRKPGQSRFTTQRREADEVKILSGVFIDEATGKQVVAVSNLQTLALFGTQDHRAVVIDARRGEVYGAVYNSRLEVEQDEVVIRLTDWLAAVSKSFPGAEFVVQRGPLAVPLPEGLGSTTIQTPQELAGAVGRIALGRFRHGFGEDPAAIDANYVRRSDAELLWREPHRA